MLKVPPRPTGNIGKDKLLIDGKIVSLEEWKEAVKRQWQI
jgi:hypothetical protein